MKSCCRAKWERVGLSEVNDVCINHPQHGHTLGVEEKGVGTGNEQKCKIGKKESHIESIFSVLEENFERIEIHRKDSYS